MASIHLRACSFAHSAATPVLDRVTVDLADGWVGVVGGNGSGKTTLLRLVAGELAPTDGEVRVVSDVPPVLCPQEVDAVDDAVVAFACDWDGPAASLRSRLDLDPDDVEDWTTLSPGQRKRWQVGAALVAAPDVLLLDEPTNHLDATARGLLLEVLSAFHGLGLVVSHDRDLLDVLADRTLRLDRGGAELHADAYPTARERWTADDRATREAPQRARREQGRLRRARAEVRHQRSGAEHAGRAARRANPGEPDVREAGRKFAQQKAEQKLANRVHQLNRRVDRATDAADALDVRRTLGGEVTMDTRDDGRRWVARLAGPVRHGDGGVVLDDVDLGVARGARVHLAGPNGAGKTTVLAALRAAAPGAVGWLPQELTAAESRTILTTVRALRPDERGRLLGIVANLGLDPDRVLVTDRPSPGEARKLRVAQLLLAPTDLLLLDEPTNHLDLPAIERLESAVAAYDGAVVVATHDLAFAGATTHTTWQVGDRTVAVDPA